MMNLFANSSSNWVKYDKYEWKKADNGTLYITPSQDAKLSLYNPVKKYQDMVLAAINIGTLATKEEPEESLQASIMDFACNYGLLGLMTALPTTPEFITYEAVYLPKNHFIREESLSTEKYLSYFFPFDNIIILYFYALVNTFFNFFRLGLFKICHMYHFVKRVKKCRFILLKC